VRDSADPQRTETPASASRPIVPAMTTFPRSTRTRLAVCAALIAASLGLSIAGGEALGDAFASVPTIQVPATPPAPPPVT